MRRAKIGSADQAKTNSCNPSKRLQLEIDRQSRTPFYRQIYARLADAIARGVLRPGERLPSARSLASHLATSRGTIDVAYSILSGEGYVRTFGAAGTVVAADFTGFPKRPAAVDRTPATQPRSETFTVKPFKMGLPALDAFPRKLWARLSTRHARALDLRAMALPDSAGYMPLREAVASYLAVSRGVLCSSAHVIITSGFQSALGLITRALYKPGDRIWLEDPCYFIVRKAFEEIGACITGVPVDAEGLSVTAGIERTPRARFAYVTPSHQAPLGVSMSLRRRMALLSWAAGTDAWIIEDDYDSEFRYGSRPLPALRSLDSNGRVIYVGSFSKVLFPGLRLGYMVAPESQIDLLERIAHLLYCDRPVLNQAIVADFMAEGHFARHIKRMRKLYAERRTAVAAALVDVFGREIDLEPQEGGMHLLARFARCRSDAVWVERCVADGLAPVALSKWRVDRDCGQGLLLGFTNLAQQDALQAALRLKQAIGNKSKLVKD